MAHEDGFPKMADISLASILEHEAVLTCFQPLVSLRRKSLFGVEALSRGLIGDAGEAIPPAILFRLALGRSDLATLDRLCRRKALEAFAPMHALSRELHLGLNIEASCLARAPAGSDHLFAQARSMGIDPANIILELDETRAADHEVLADFVSAHREAGFLIGLDRAGGPGSDIERIAALKPDMVKIDRRLVAGIHEAAHKQEMVRGLVATASRVGALPAAVGVESAEEIIQLLELGIELFQGHFFARPYPGAAKRPEVSTAIESVAARFKDHVLRKINASKEQHKVYNIVIDQVLDALSKASLPELDAALAAILDLHPGLQCAYVLNETGLQISGTVCNTSVAPREWRLRHQPGHKGADHSLTEHFLSIKAGLTRYTTEPGISRITGHPGRTICTSFRDASSRPRILCLEISLPE